MTPSFGELLGLEILDAREAKGWTQLALAELAFGDHQSERRIRDYELGKVKRPQAKVYLHICDSLGISRQRISELKSISGDARAINRAEIAEIRAELGSLSEALSNLERMNRQELESLAVLFGQSNAHDVEVIRLLEFLHLKAVDYRGLREQVDAIPPDLIKLSRIKSLASAALDVGNFEEVEALLAGAHALELDGAGETAKLRAKNALLSGRVAQAAEILRATADGFGAVDINASALRRTEFAKILYVYGCMYGGSALASAASMYRDVPSYLTSQVWFAHWLTAQNGLAQTLIELGARDGSASASTQLSEAETISSELCRITQAIDFPNEWATAHYQQGRARRYQGIRANEEMGIKILESAISSFELASHIWSLGKYPEDWARLQIDWATVENYLGDKLKHGDKTSTLLAAAKRFKLVENSLLREFSPTLWSLLHNNLAVCLFDLGRNTSGDQRREFFRQSIHSSEKALSVREKSSNPVGWAQTQNNLAIAKLELGLCDSDLAMLQNSAEACAAALEVRTIDGMPLLYGVTKVNLARARLAMGSLAQGAERAFLLKNANEDIVSAINVFDPHEAPMYLAWALEVKEEIDSVE